MGRIAALLNILKRQFYERDPSLVARELLGKRLTMRLNGEILEGVIVETEAYYGMSDPASRAYHGAKNYNRVMWGEAGIAFVYNVHRYSMFNVVAHEPGDVGAVLIRALEPKRGIETMVRNRPVKDIHQLTSGPGKITQAFGIDKRLHGVDVTVEQGEIIISEGERELQIGSSRRIGVARDLEEKLRFFVDGNKFVSR